MYPSKDALLPHEALERVRAAPAAAGEGRPDSAVTLVIVDGTWSQAKSMFRRVDALASKVRLSGRTPMRFPMLRSGKCVGRVSTMAAVLIFLEEYGDLAAGEYAHLNALLSVLSTEFFEQVTVCAAKNGKQTLSSYRASGADLPPGASLETWAEQGIVYQPTGKRKRRKGRREAPESGSAETDVTK